MNILDSIKIKKHSITMSSYQDILMGLQKNVTNEFYKTIGIDTDEKLRDFEKIFDKCSELKELIDKYFPRFADQLPIKHPADEVTEIIREKCECLVKDIFEYEQPFFKSFHPDFSLKNPLQPR